MSNVINLIKYQFNTILSIRKQTMILLIFAILGPMLDDMLLPWSGLCIVYLGIMHSIGYEYRSEIDTLISYLPVKPSEYILSRYISSILYIIISVVMTSVLYFLAKTIRFNSQMPSLESILLILLLSAAVIVIFIVPIVTINGPEKSRMIVVFLCVIPMVGSMSAVDNPTALSLINHILSLDKGILMVLIIFSICILFVLSYCVASYIYSKKEIK